jgi:peptide methionine sulfoxide reductase msrA/msrB
MARMEKATFAGGCFWCIEDTIRSMNGVGEAMSGYTGGDKDNPTYEDVCSGTTGHYEAVQVTFDPEKISYEQLLEWFWKQIDPTDPEGQFADRGPQYRTAIFYHSEEQRKKAEESKRRLEESGRFDKPIATKIIKAGRFYEAEKYHQDYSEKNPDHYKAYKEGSGRACYIKNTWR